MNIGQKLKLLREKNHLTQTEVAKKLGISQGSYAIWEKKTTNQTLNMLEKVAQFYDIPFQVLLDEEQNPQAFIDLINNYGRLHPDQKETLVDLAKIMAQKK